ncbi:MAG: glycosyl hydrolase [Nocardia sp.]|uniref:beta-glucosidase family protein n=1 Tax=Nocardia sp. TaxID=1821 RepID=UPI00260E98D2|nr:glycoside hydrolase family 3 C-terminal domain-containing protein [Nocardia sp.]MCU1642533.1 glycosyl hydrolase [Nocardia sp.]
MDNRDHATVVESALARLDLDAKTRLLAGQDVWSLPALPEIGLQSLVMSDGPVGVRGPAWNAADPALTLPSPTALAATWDTGLARRTGRVLAQESRRKGVHLLLAPTVNLHRSPLGGRHFESYSEDPLLTARIGGSYVGGVQDGGVGATVKHFVANDAETERFTVDNRIDERTLRELYLAPFEDIIAAARPWAIMSAYNRVNGVTMTEHRDLQVGVLRGEWNFDGVVISDWLAARNTVGAITGGLDIAMPGPTTIYGPALAAAVRAGKVEEALVDNAARRVLLLAARAGLLAGAEPAVPASALPAPIDGRALAREIAARSFVLLRNEGGVLPLDPVPGSIALIGAAAREARILGGGSATVFPERIVSPLDGLRDALSGNTSLVYERGADPGDGLGVAGVDFVLRTVLRDECGTILADEPAQRGGEIRWLADGLPGGVDYAKLASVEIIGIFTPRRSGAHSFGTKGAGGFRLIVDGVTLLDDVESPALVDPIDAITGRSVPRGQVELVADRPVLVRLLASAPRLEFGALRGVSFGLTHRDPVVDDDQRLDAAVAAAAAADVAVVVVSTTEFVESEGFDRTDLRLPGRQDELVRRVAAVNPRTVVVVNAGSPVEMPWRTEVSAILLTWFPGQEAGAALADVLLGVAEPGGRLPTTWPARLADAPVTEVVPDHGVLEYSEGPHIGYRAWQRHDISPAYPFGHGLGYTEWDYESIESAAGTVNVRVRNIGSRPGREIVQVYAASADEDPARPDRWLAGFATVDAAPGESVEVPIALPERTFQRWDEHTGKWATVPGRYELHAGRHSDASELSVPLHITA